MAKGDKKKKKKAAAQAAGATEQQGDGAEEVPSAGALSERLELQRTRVICGPEMNYHVNTVTSALAYMSVGYDNAWHFPRWAAGFSIELTRRDKDSLEFEMVGVDPAIVNALRRILIAEVPTVAIEHVFVIDNTTEMAEEVLAHRLGLVPLTVDAEELTVKDVTPSESNTVVFKLCVECKRDAGGQVVNRKVMARDLEWLPGGSEYPDETSTKFSASQDGKFASAPAAVHPDILLCKLAPGQRVELEAHAIRGQGWDHAKWSPVATAWHRLYPEIAIKQAVPKDVAHKLAEAVPKVFSVSKQEHKAKGWLQAENIRHHDLLLDPVRDLTAEEEYAEYIEVRKRKEHCIFTIEPCVATAPEVLFMRAIDILKQKCKRLNAML